MSNLISDIDENIWLMFTLNKENIWYNDEVINDFVLSFAKEWWKKSVLN